MTEADKCPTCKGWCCANHNEKFGPSIHYQHGWTKVHFCSDCEEGLAWTAYTEPAPKPAWTAEQERAAVVAWLLKLFPDNMMFSFLLNGVARRIACGEHRRVETE